MDVDAMVKKLMKARESSYDKMVKNRTRAEWKQEDYRAISTKIVDFRNNKILAYNNSNVISAKTAQISGDTNALTINKTNSSAAGNLAVNVTKIATAANDVYTFSNPTNTLEQLGFIVETEMVGGVPTPTNNVSAMINGKKITVAKDAKLADLAAAINANSGTLKATAVFDASGKLSLAATQTGAAGLNVAGMPNIGVTKTTITAGADASVTVNGIDYTSKNNQFSVNGFEFTVKAQTIAGSPSIISAQQDNNKIVDTIKSFIADYNSLMGAINSELAEVKSRDFTPLSSDEKKAMTDDDIKRWEEKARNGSLRNDNTLTKLASELRLAAVSLIGGIKDEAGNSISIGITTGSYTEKGKLILDEKKLRAALDTDSDKVTSLFMDNSKGVFRSMSNSSMSALTDLSKKAGTSLVSTDLTGNFRSDSILSKEIAEMKGRERAMLRRLSMIEQQYYKKFTAMETAINKFNAQAGSLKSL